MNNKTLAQIIQNNIRVKNLEAESGSCDIVVYDNADGTNFIENIALEIGATYEMFVTSAVDLYAGEKQYGQQKITIKLIPAELNQNNYVFYAPIHYYDVYDSNVNSTCMFITNELNTKLWDINIVYIPVKIYKIIKKGGIIL